MKILMILAMDEEGGIGINNNLPWPRNRTDMNHFMTCTWGAIVVMGRKTWESLPKKLPNRINVVVSSQDDIQGADYVIGSDIMTELEYIHRQCGYKQIFVIGGKTLYEYFQPYAHTINLTIMDGVFDCDTHIDAKKLLNGFNMVKSENMGLSTKSTGVREFREYRRGP